MGHQLEVVNVVVGLSIGEIIVIKLRQSVEQKGVQEKILLVLMLKNAIVLTIVNILCHFVIIIINKVIALN